jgi:hypothetical protein
MNTLDACKLLFLDFSPEERAIPESATYPGRHLAVLTALNTALQEMCCDGYPWVSKDERGAILNPPASGVEITVTEGSIAAEVSVGTWKDWFAGCAIKIDGSSWENQIKNDVRQVKLAIPHDGPSGTTTATVYHNRVALPTDAIALAGIPKVDGVPLTPSPNAEDGMGLREFDYGPRAMISDRSISQRNVGDWLGRPMAYKTETWKKDDVSGPYIRMLLTPGCDQKRKLSFGVYLRPAEILAVNSNDNLPIPFQFVQKLLIPIARFHLSTSSFFRNEEGRSTINAAYRAAKDELASLSPRRATGVKMVPKF